LVVGIPNRPPSSIEGDWGLFAGVTALIDKIVEEQEVEEVEKE
jgi:hypothetical protein